MLSLINRFILGRRHVSRYSSRSLLLLIVLLVLITFAVHQDLLFEEIENPDIVKQTMNAAFKVHLAESRKIDRQKHMIDDGRDGDTRKRQNLIIMAHGRSGSTFLGNIFNHHPDVFYLFEPYQTMERLHGRAEPENQHYQAKAFQWMKGVLQCDFVSLEHVKDLQLFYRRKYRAYYNPQKSLSLLSPPFCPYNATDPLWTMESCPPLDQRTLEETCKSKYSLTVVKVIMSRMPGGSIKQLLSICDTAQFDCKFIFLTRDPRAIIPSSKAVGFFTEEKGSLNGTKKFSQTICKTTVVGFRAPLYLSYLPSNRRTVRFFRSSCDPLTDLYPSTPIT